MSEFNNQQGNQEQKTTQTHQARQDRLKEIQALYREQIKEIYNESRSKIQKQEQTKKLPESDCKNQNISSKKSILTHTSQLEKTINHVKSVSTLNIADSRSGSKYYPLQIDEQLRPSTFLRGESTKTMEMLRRENQTKELKIRQLTNKIQSLVEKLKRHMKPEQFQGEMEKLREFSDSKMERLQNLFKIKNEQIFFKIKLQIIGLLQEFGVAKQQLAEIQEVINESTLIAFMTKKLKGRLKDFKSKEQESHFSIQQDKILEQKQEQRIHYLMETNELLRLSESKLKNKIEDLKSQLNNFLELLKQREKENEQRQSQVFRLKKQLQDLNGTNQKLAIVIRDINSQKLDEQRIWQAKINEMKLLLSNYFVEKNKLSSELEQKQGQIEEIIIKSKFLEQENERSNRELVRWKERYDWLEKEKEIKSKELQQENSNLVTIFEKYKEEHNEGIIMSHKSQTDQALRKVDDYQRAYEEMINKLQDQRSLLSRAEEQNQEKIEKLERKWMERIKEFQKLKEQELLEINNENQLRQTELKKEYEKKETLLAEEMQARMKTLLAQKDKKTTQQFIQLETQNDQLRREIQNLHKVLSVKESLINVISSKKISYD